MSLEGTVLYEQFVDARRVAVELTDHYNQIPKSDPTKDEVWDRVVRQTEAARQLLELWLRAGGSFPSSVSARERAAAHSR